MGIVRPQGPLDCIEERRTVDGFTKKRRRIHFLCFQSGSRIVVSGNNYDRQLYTACLEFSLQFLSRHPGHSHVQHHTSERVGIESVEEIVCGSKVTDFVACCAQQA